MSYADIENLYKNRRIMLFKECYAMEKIHGTSAHVGWKRILDAEMRKPSEQGKKNGILEDHLREGIILRLCRR